MENGAADEVRVRGYGGNAVTGRDCQRIDVELTGDREILPDGGEMDTANRRCYALSSP
jgi:hypothetical protein